MNLPPSLLPAIFAFSAVTFGTIALALLWEAIRRNARTRAVMRQLNRSAEQNVDVLPELIHGEPEGGLGAVLASFPPFRDAALELRRSGLDWSPVTLATMVFGAAAAFGLLALLLGTGLLLALLVGLLGAFLPYLYVKHKQRARIRAFEEQFPEAIDLMGRAIRAGHPMSAGVRMVAEESPEPIRSEFRQIFEEQRFGLPFEEALLGLADRNQLADVRIFVAALLVQREVGGNLAEILDKIAMTIRARFTIRRQLRVYTAQGRLSGYVLAVMPIAVAGAIFMIDSSYASMLISEPLGRAMVAVAVIMQILGYLWIRRIVDIEI